jgi:hypothetical protein
MMKMMKRFLGAALLAALFFVYPAQAVMTDTFDAATSMTEVGGLPICVTVTGASESSEAANTITLPVGFDATYVSVIDDYNATNSSLCEWFYGMPDNSAILTTGSTGVRTYISTAAIDSDAGTIVLGTGCQINSGDYLVRACR